MNHLVTQILRAIIVVSLPISMFACGDAANDEEQPGSIANDERRVPVRLAVADQREVLVELHSVGRLVSRNRPSLAAEIDARVIAVLVEEGESVVEGQDLILLDTTATELAKREAQAVIERLKVSIANEKRRVERYRGLKTKDMMPQERLDDAEAQLAVDQASLSAAEARLAIAQDRLAKARLVSPVDGVVETRHVSVGDFAKFGSPLVMVTDTRSMRALLPFPETVGYLLKEGQTLLIESPLAPGQVLESTVDQIRPQVAAMNRSLVVISDVENPGFWRPEATIEATVVVERRSHAVVVPAISVVSRPAGDVVYVVDSGRARQQVVETGEKQDGWVEIRKGLKAGESIATEGAYYLTDGVAVSVDTMGQMQESG